VYDRLFLRAAGALSLCVIASTATAQRPGTLMSRPVDPLNDARVAAEREQRLRNLHPSKNEPLSADDQRAIVAAVAQVKDDFERIQVVRNEISDVLHAGSAIDFAALAAKAKEINKRAKRLQQFLLPDAAEAHDEKAKSADEPGPTRVRNDAVVLCHTIAAFVENPAVVSTGAVDSSQAAAATRDLQRVIDLSEEVRRNAERLAKAKDR
jgi:hypothetical protein